MKLLYILFLITAIPLLVQAQSVEGTWHVSVSQSIALMDASAKTRYDGLHTKIRQRLTDSFEQRAFTFNSDGSIRAAWQSDNLPREVTGTWTLVGETLTMTAGGITLVYSVSYPAAGVLILQATGSSGIFTHLYLTLEP